MTEGSPMPRAEISAKGKANGARVVGRICEAVGTTARWGVTEGLSKAAGKIVCMSSVHERIPWACHGTYAASNGGVMLMMQSVAQKVVPLRIRVNSIAP